MGVGKVIGGYQWVFARGSCNKNNGHGDKRSRRSTQIGMQESFTMNIITFNVRGLGRGLKWPAIRRLVNKQKIDMICLQETKKEVINKSMC